MTLILLAAFAIFAVFLYRALSYTLDRVTWWFKLKRAMHLSRRTKKPPEDEIQPRGW